MRTIEVGAFEAKTHLSQLLDEVEQGAVVKISRRGRLVAVLKQDELSSRSHVIQSLEQLRSIGGQKMSRQEIEALRDKGRER